MKNKKTLVLGASLKPERYAFKAITMLVEKGHSVIAIGPNTGDVAGIKIRTKNIPLSNINTHQCNFYWLGILAKYYVCNNSDYLSSRRMDS